MASLYHKHFRGGRRERLFLSSLSFFITFGIVRAITHAIRAGQGTLGNISIGGIHVHHLVFGIGLLLLVGYLWLVEIDSGDSALSLWLKRLMAVLYGLAAALTLDEFALWLNLQDVYWSGAGRQSIDAVLLFGALLSVGFWGGPFFRDLIHEAGRVFRDR